MSTSKLKVLVYIVITVALLALLIYDKGKTERRKENAAFTEGVITGKSKVAKGERYVDYTFKVNGKVYKGCVSVAFCKKCKQCCQVGARVTVRYERNNPSNNDLIAE